MLSVASINAIVSSVWDSQIGAAMMLIVDMMIREILAWFLCALRSLLISIRRNPKTSGMTAEYKMLLYPLAIVSIPEKTPNSIEATPAKAVKIPIMLICFLMFMWILKDSG